MQVIQVTAGADGVLRFELPVGAPGTYEVAVRRKSPEELGWPPGYFERTAGVIDDPTFERGPQGTYERRGEF